MTMRIKNVLSKLKKFLLSEGGQTSTEYILLIAVVVLIILKFRKIYQEKLIQLMDKVFDKANIIERDIAELN